MIQKSKKNGGKLLFTFVAGVVAGTLTSYFSKKENRDEIVTKYNDSKQILQDKADEIKTNIVKQVKEEKKQNSPIRKKNKSSKVKTA